MDRIIRLTDETTGEVFNVTIRPHGEVFRMFNDDGTWDGFEYPTVQDAEDCVWFAILGGECPQLSMEVTA